MVPQRKKQRRSDRILFRPARRQLLLTRGSPNAAATHTKLRSRILDIIIVAGSRRVCPFWENGTQQHGGETVDLLGRGVSRSNSILSSRSDNDSCLSIIIIHIPKRGRHNKSEDDRSKTSYNQRRFLDY